MRAAPPNAPRRLVSQAFPRAVGALAVGVLAACTGVIHDPEGAARPDASVAIPGPLLLRRLTNAEYDRTVRDLLGQTTRVSADFPADAKVFGFDDGAVSLTISPLHAERYRDAAERIGAEVTASPARMASVVGCDLTGTGRAPCLARFVGSFARRAYRRPLVDAEVQGLLHVADVAADDPDRNAAVALIIEAVLQSPSFLFRAEFGAPDPSRPGLYRLGRFDLASRLSYLLWGTTPDDALLDTAQAGTLDTAEGLAQTARTMLADARAHEGLAAFYGQWLRLYTLATVHRDATQYPSWSPELSASMSEETSRTVDDLVWRDGANFLDLLTGHSTFLDGRLATLYGLAPPAAGTWARTDLTDHPERGGLLTQASYLTLTAHSEGSMLIHRGKYVREVLLCETLPTPPANVPTIPAPVPGETDVERLERHRSDPSCNGCHRLMDPVGMGMHRYDSIGAFHLVDAQQRAISQAGTLYGYTPPDFDGPTELSRRLRDLPEVSQCVVRQVFRYAFGRAEVMTAAGDLPQIERTTERFRSSQYSFREMLVSLVASDAFRYGRPAGGGS